MGQRNRTDWNAVAIHLVLVLLSVIWAAIIVLIVSCAGCAVPDEFNIGYGHEWRGSSEIGFDPYIDFDEGDSDFVNVGLTWRLKPLEVIPLRTDPIDPAYLEPLEHTNDPADAVTTFDALDWTTKIALVVAVCWLGWVYRKQLGRLIPGRNGNA